MVSGSLQVLRLPPPLKLAEILLKVVLNIITLTVCMMSDIYIVVINFYCICRMCYILTKYAGFELTALVVIDTDCTGSCKSNYHTITTTTGSGCC
jgi:hypothetical protein